MSSRDRAPPSSLPPAGPSRRCTAGRRGSAAFTAALWLGAGAAACTPPRSAPLPGWDEPPAPPSAALLASAPRAAPSARAAVTGPPWKLTDELAHVKRVLAPAPSQHLDGSSSAEVLANDAVGAYPRAGAGIAVPPGATVVEKLSFSAGGEASTYFVMVKRPAGFDPAGGDWEYLVVDPAGTIEERGVLPLCARCHAEAPRDRLFGG